MSDKSQTTQQITTVVNISHEQCDVYVGRPSIFGNPFIIGTHGSREEVVEKYREWVLTQPEILARLPELKGKKLGCWCAPSLCHADVLIELLRHRQIEESFQYD